MDEAGNLDYVPEESYTEEMDELDKLAYTHKRYLTPKEIAAYVLVNFGQKNLTQFVDAFKEFFMIQFLKLNSTAYANINLFASIYDALDDTISVFFPFFSLPGPTAMTTAVCGFSFANILFSLFIKYI